MLARFVVHYATSTAYAFTSAVNAPSTFPCPPSPTTFFLFPPSRDALCSPFPFLHPPLPPTDRKRTMDGDDQTGGCVLLLLFSISIIASCPPKISIEILQKRVKRGRGKEVDLIISVKSENKTFVCFLQKFVSREKNLSREKCEVICSRLG